MEIVQIKKTTGALTIKLKAPRHTGMKNNDTPRIKIRTEQAKTVLQQNGHNPGILLHGSLIDNAEFSRDFNLEGTWIFVDLDHKESVKKTTNKRQPKKKKEE